MKLSERKRTLDCKLYWYPKFYKYIFVFTGLKKTLGSLNFDFLVPTSLANNSNLQKVNITFIIIEDVH